MAANVGAPTLDINIISLVVYNYINSAEIAKLYNI